MLIITRYPLRIYFNIKKEIKKPLVWETNGGEDGSGAFYDPAIVAPLSLSSPLKIHCLLWQDLKGVSPINFCQVIKKAAVRLQNLDKISTILTVDF